MSDIILISGSTLGSAEDVADHLAEKLEAAGFTTETLHGPDLDELTQRGTWLIITSTHGAGDIPDNLQPLSEQIAEQKPDLSQVHFGTVGLGSSDYDLFCGAIKKLETQLIAQGAKRIGERLEIDVIKYEIPEDPADEWIKNWINLL